MLTATLLTPLLAFCGALVAVLVALRGARQLEGRSLREETMRNLRWAAELAIGPDPALAALGVTQLEALERSVGLDTYERRMVKAALDIMSPRPRRGEEDAS